MSLPDRFLFLAIAIAVCGCRPAMTSADVSYQVMTVVQETNTANPPTPMLEFVGRNSCSATACHGRPQSTPVSWRNAYQLWEATDPHRRAFDVLYTERSVRMYRLLHRVEESSEPIEEKVYLQFLEKNCIGCHATPPQTTAAGSFVQQPSAEVYWQGVSCESCHGPASHWLGTHYAKTWPESSAPGRANLTANGFQDMRLLEQRAETCLQCHHGPKRIGDETYDVNHDLLAAGHPRLKFELHAYLANLPKHWNEAAEIKRQASSPADAFHFNTWRAGQTALAAQDKRLKQARAKSADKSDLSEWAEFANHDCRHCHHVPAESNFRLTFSKQVGPPPNLFQNVPLTPTISQRATVLLRLLGQARKQNSASLLPSSDQGVDIYLAAAAFANDFPNQPPFTDLARMDQLLAAQAGKTQYDLPGNFNPEEPELKQALSELQQTLEQLARP